jgi:hypothetical protein
MFIAGETREAFVSPAERVVAPLPIVVAKSLGGASSPTDLESGLAQRDLRLMGCHLAVRVRLSAFGPMDRNGVARGVHGEAWWQLDGLWPGPGLFADGRDGSKTAACPGDRNRKAHQLMAR